MNDIQAIVTMLVGAMTLAIWFEAARAVVWGAVFYWFAKRAMRSAAEPAKARTCVACKRYVRAGQANCRLHGGS